MAIDTIDVAALVQSAIEKALSERGFVNVLVVGKTGTGKSTLVNTVFNERIAETGQGRPITQHMHRYTKEGSPVSIYDTKGLEVADYRAILDDLKSKVREINRSPRAEDHVHVAWLCIAEGTRRVEEAELELAKILDECSVPVVVVITTAISDQGFRAEVRNAFHSASNVVRVNSEPYVMDEGIVAPVKGVDVLVDATMEVVPKGQKSAFAAAQRIKVDHKVRAAMWPLHRLRPWRWARERPRFLFLMPPPSFPSKCDDRLDQRHFWSEHNNRLSNYFGDVFARVY